MKKWIKSILCGLLVVATLLFASCGSFTEVLGGDSPTRYNKKTPLQTYTAIEKKIEEAESGTIETTMQADAKYEKKTTKITLGMISKSTATRGYSEVSAKVGTQSEKAKVWYAGGFLYVNASGVKVKKLTTIEEYRSYIKDSNKNSSTLFKVEDLSGVEFVKEEGGAYFVAPLAESEIKTLASSISGSSKGITLSNIEYLVHIDENSDLRYLELNFNMVQTVSNETVNYTVKCTIYIKDLNTTVIKAPTDADKYIDVTDY